MVFCVAGSRLLADLVPVSRGESNFHQFLSVN